jgi:hypothetical protein
MKKSKRLTTSRGSDARQELINAARDGGITLVLGAGVSMARGIPDWNCLAKTAWEDAFPNSPSPWLSSGGPSPRSLPQFLPIIFERIYRERNEAGFVNLLRKHLYAKAKLPSQDPRFPKSNESLAVLARLLAAEHRRKGNRRIASIITFNADDLIEQAVERVASAGVVRPIVRPIVRSTHVFTGQVSQPVIPVYHVHGFVSSRPETDDSRMLVFTDSQYWSTSATSTSFANRVMASALSEGRCVFIGLSMTDINLLRWLALRNLDRDGDQLFFEQATSIVVLKGSSNPSSWLDRHYRRHFWIRPPSTDPNAFLADFLSYRGIQTVDITSWHDSSLHELIRKCFPPASRV